MKAMMKTGVWLVAFIGLLGLAETSSAQTPHQRQMAYQEHMAQMQMAQQQMAYQQQAAVAQQYWAAQQHAAQVAQQQRTGPPPFAGADGVYRLPILKPPSQGDMSYFQSTMSKLLDAFSWAF